MSEKLQSPVGRSIDRPSSDGPSWVYFILTRRASPDLALSPLQPVLDNRNMTVLIAVCTRPMRWSGAAFRWFQYIGKSPVPYVFKFIAILCLFPMFQTEPFLFQARFMRSNNAACADCAARIFS